MLEREINYATDNMESAMGMPGILPKFPERQPPKIIQTGGITLNNIHVSRSEIGVLNTGVIENVDSTLTVLKTQGNAELAAAVTGLSEAVIKATEITAEQKNQIIELLSALSEEAVAPKEKQKKSVIKALIQHLEDLLKGVSTITGLWNIAKTIFLKIFGI
ncbi:MAG: hypothetical protein Q8R05_03410 [Candidatus Omnitrophota bacterium]|nr:hypothetical protein [Candidatus Omnitrophota bacterium]